MLIQIKLPCMIFDCIIIVSDCNVFRPKTLQRAVTFLLLLLFTELREGNESPEHQNGLTTNTYIDSVNWYSWQYVIPPLYSR